MIFSTGVQASGQTPHEKAVLEAVSEQCPECSICIRSSEERSTEERKDLACGHGFCKNCIDTWLKESPSCPLCRAPVAQTVAARTRNQALSTTPNAPLSVQNHVFDFNRYNGGHDAAIRHRAVHSDQNYYTVAPEFHQEVRDFMLALTDEEYTALMNRYGDAPEYSVSAQPTWLDADWLTLEQRKNNFRRDVSLSYDQSVLPIEDAAYRSLSATKRNERFMANYNAALDLE